MMLRHTYQAFVIAMRRKCLISGKKYKNSEEQKKRRKKENALSGPLVPEEKTHVEQNNSTRLHTFRLMLSQIQAQSSRAASLTTDL